MPEKMPQFSLPSGLHVFTQFSFIFTCKCKLALANFTRYIYLPRDKLMLVYR